MLAVQPGKDTCCIRMAPRTSEIGGGKFPLFPRGKITPGAHLRTDKDAGGNCARCLYGYFTLLIIFSFYLQDYLSLFPVHRQHRPHETFG